MHAIGPASAVYLVFLLALIPWAAFRSAGAFTEHVSAGASTGLNLPGRPRSYLNSSAALAVLFALAWFTARHVDYAMFAVPRIDARDLWAGACVLLLQFALMFVSDAVRTPAERRAMPVNRLMPRTAGERVLYSATALWAGIAEEAAYRGVLTIILWHVLGIGWLAVFLSALAFSLAHAVQGWKSMIVIFVMACALQALVWLTRTLVIAMAVHAAYDLLVPTVRRRIVLERPTAPGRSAG